MFKGKYSVKTYVVVEHIKMESVILKYYGVLNDNTHSAKSRDWIKEKRRYLGRPLAFYSV